MNTELNTRKELVENELEMANGGSDWGYFSYVMFRGADEENDSKSLVLPGMDVDNRPPIDISLHTPTLKQA